MTDTPDAEFDRFVTEYRLRLRRRAYLLCGDWYQADDLVQASLVKLLSRWSELDRRDQLFGYVCTIMVRTFISSTRSAASSREVLADSVPEPLWISDSQDHVADRLLLIDALDQLGRRQRATLVLLYWEDLSVGQVASALGCTPETVRSQASRALRHLRARLGSRSAIEVS